MQSTFEIAHLSKEDKLKIMEALWEDLSKDYEDIESPVWHHDVLQDTEQRLELGEERAIDWDTAKKDLRKRFK